MIRKAFYIAAKDLMQLRKDRGALLMMFAVPLLLMAVLGSVFNSANSTSSVTATIPVIEHDHGREAAAFLASLRRAPSIKLQIRSDQAAMEKAVRDGDQVGLLIIPANFSSALGASHGEARVSYYSVSNNNSVDAQVALDTVRGAVQQFDFEATMTGVVAQAQTQTGGKVNAALTSRLVAQAEQRLNTTPPVALETINATGRNANGIDNTVPGYALMFALFALTNSAGSILEEKESGTFKRLLVAPLPPAVLLGGKLIAQFVQTLVQLTVLFVLGVLLFKINLGLLHSGARAHHRRH